MKLHVFFLTVAAFVSQHVFAQVVFLKNPINTSMSDDFNPSVSGDGKTLLYEMVYWNTNKADVMISYQVNNSWSVPVVVPGVNTKSETLTNGGYFINHAGDIILFHSNRFRGIGGTDIYFSEKNAAGGWSAPVNFGKPINSTGNELDPSLSPDGKYMYYTVLSDKKTPSGKPCGKIMVTERISSTSWKEPVELPSTINTGCECGGKLLSDNKTFLFSSMRAGGKGGYDFYKSIRSENGSFSTPVNFAFVNTANDDKYISIAAGGSMLYSDAPGKGKDERDIIIAKVPEDMQPEMVKLYQGKVLNATTQKPLAAQITVTHVKTGFTMVYRTTADGSYSVPVLASGDYDVSIFPATPGFEYKSFYEPTATTIKYEYKEIKYELKPLVKGSTFELTTIAFNDSLELDAKSELELNRVKLLLKVNPLMKIHLIAYTDKVEIDTIRHHARDKEIVNLEDSTITYSNDYSSHEAKILNDYLLKAGIPASRITYNGMGVNAAEARKKYEVVVK